MNWNDVYKSALLGTQRQPLHLATSEATNQSPVQNMVARLDSADPEGTLLGAVATFLFYQQAGRIPVVDWGTIPPACDTETLPRCSTHACLFLERMLNDEYRDVLPEWLAIVRTAGQRVPEEYLPALLEAGRTRTYLREHIPPVIGKRGVWLADCNPKWDYVLWQTPDFYVCDSADETQRSAKDELIETTWQTGPRLARLAMLRQLRGLDPARARELVMSTWKTEKTDDRKRFLEFFETGLSMDDEPFLEESLNDRKQELRTAATNLLARLPESRLSQRMRERAAPLLTFKHNRLRKPAIEVILPNVCDDAMVRDGIQCGAPMSFKAGEKAWWLSQILACVPPSFWYTQWDVSPDEMVQAALRSEWKNVFLYAWGRAACQVRDTACMQALWPAIVEQASKKNQESKNEATLLMKHLSPSFVENWIVQSINEHPEPLHAAHPAMWMLQQWMQTEHPWGEELTRRVVTSVRERLVAGFATQKGIFLDRDWLIRSAVFMAPTLLTEMASGWPVDSEGWKEYGGYIGTIIDVLEFRHEMRKSFV